MVRTASGVGGVGSCVSARALAAVAAAAAVAALGAAMLITGCAPARPPEASPAERESGPVIRLDKAKWEFGTIERGETVATPLGIFNPGTDSLLVTLRTSCECFTLSRDSLAVAPRQVEWITLILQGPVVKDPTIKTLYVDSNDPATPRVTFVAEGAVTGSSRPYLAAVPDPAPLAAPDSSAGVEAGYLSAEIVIENRGREDLTVTQVRCFGCLGDWTEAVILGGASSVLYVEALPDWSGQRWLEIDSNDPVWPLKKIVLVDLPQR